MPVSVIFPDMHKGISYHFRIDKVCLLGHSCAMATIYKDQAMVDLHWIYWTKTTAWMFSLYVSPTRFTAILPWCGLSLLCRGLDWQFPDRLVTGMHIHWGRNRRIRPSDVVHTHARELYPLRCDVTLWELHSGG